MEKYWRLSSQHSYLQGERFVKIRFVPTEQCDHTHCAFCWDKFGPDNEWLQTGYCTTDKYHWVCEQCFLDFKNRFNWEVISTD